MKNRRAASLVELLVVISACSVILTLSAAAIHRAMHGHSKARAFADAEHSAVRLFHQFRQDVGRAETAVVEQAELDEGVFLRLTLASGQSVRYWREKNRVLRTLSISGDQVWREVYAFPENSQLAIRRELLPDRLVLTLTAEADVRSQATSPARLSARTIPVMLQVVARIGRDNRLAAVTPQE